MSSPTSKNILDSKILKNYLNQLFASKTPIADDDIAMLQRQLDALLKKNPKEAEFEQGDIFIKNLISSVITKLEVNAIKPYIDFLTNVLQKTNIEDLSLYQLANSYTKDAFALDKHTGMMHAAVEIIVGRISSDKLNKISSPELEDTSVLFNKLYSSLERNQSMVDQKMDEEEARQYRELLERWKQGKGKRTKENIKPDAINKDKTPKEPIRDTKLERTSSGKGKAVTPLKNISKANHSSSGGGGTNLKSPKSPKTPRSPKTS